MPAESLQSLPDPSPREEILSCYIATLNTNTTNMEADVHLLVRKHANW
jgi:hypothetical protein